MWWYCKTEESGTMIFCENEQCPIKWFHVKCLRITNIPKTKLFYPECRRDKKTRTSHINGTTGSQKLHNARQITTILSIILVTVVSSHIIILMGRIDCKIVYFCLRTPMTLSPYIHHVFAHVKFGEPGQLQVEKVASFPL